MLADTLNISLDVPQAGDFGAALGAARLGMMAATGAGAEIATQPKLARSVDPDPQMQTAMAEAYARYKHAYSVLKDL
jgi:xylulokinase